MFFINVPLGVAAGLLALRLRAPAAGRPPLARPAGGALLVTGGLVVLVYALDGAAEPRLGLRPHARACWRSRRRCSPRSPPSSGASPAPLVAPADVAGALARVERAR